MKECRKYKFLSALALVLFFVSCGKNGIQEHQLVGEALGTTYSIKYFSNEKLDVKPALDSLFEVVNHSMSTYRENSDISKLNRGDTTVMVDKHFTEVLRLSKIVNKNSNGYFDPTVGNLVNAYGFGSGKQLKEFDSLVIDSLLQYVGLDKIVIVPNGKVVKESPKTYIEFNAIAKGYTVDLIAEFFNAKGINNYLIELGGELLAKGENLSKETTWTVGIDDPNQEEGHRDLATSIFLRNKAMATSGNYRKFRIDPVTGIKYVHTINPKTGHPEKSNILSVSILAENCALADAYATACMAMGLEKSKEMLAKLPSLDAYIIYSEGKDKKSVFATSGFQSVVVKEASHKPE